MRIKVLTLFPEMFFPVIQASILGRAGKKGLLFVEPVDIRAFSKDKHRRADDYPYGGGAGLVMTPQPILDAMQYAQNDAGDKFKRIYLSPKGRVFTQNIAEELALLPSLILLCGHYEGIDQRVLDSCIDDEISIGDYVLTGGELPAMVLIDAIARLVPGVLGSEDSSLDESFSSGLLEYPQYTHPSNITHDYLAHEASVPDVLLNGNHAHINRWRREMALSLTYTRRPDLLKKAKLDKHDFEFIAKLPHNSHYGS